MNNNKELILKKILIFTMIFMTMTMLSCYADNKKTILTSTQATYSITARLCKNTSLQAVHLFPQGVKLESQVWYFKNNKKDLEKKLSNALAVVSLRSAFPGDPIFPEARSKNIFTIEIDAALPFDRKKSGVPTLESPVKKDTHGSHFLPIWMSLSNASIMADIISGDLVKLSPEDKKIISTNLKSLKQEIFRLRTKYESKFAYFESLEAAAMTDDFIYLTENFNIDVLNYFTKTEIDWTDKDLKEFKKILTDDEIKVVIHKWTPNKKIMDAIKQTGAKLVVLDSMNPGDSTENGVKVPGYFETMEKNLHELSKAFN